MGREYYDEAYQIESRKFPAIFRFTNINKIILIALVGIYVIGTIALCFYLGEGEDVDTFFLLLAVVLNLLILGFGYKCIMGNAPYFFQGLALVVIPIWSVLIFVIPDKFGVISNKLFILPLVWFEIMMIVEKVIHTRAQRLAMDFDARDRENYHKIDREIL